MTNEDLEKIDGLERLLIDHNVSLEAISRRYSLCLLDILKEIRHSVEFQSGIDEVVNLLEFALKPETLLQDVDYLKRARARLWIIEREYRDSFPALSAIARCAIFGFLNAASWEGENTGDETPLYFMLYALEKIDKKYIEELLVDFENLLPKH